MIRILVAHGTRRPEGVGAVGDLAARVGALLGGPVRVAFVDVLGPTPEEVLAALAGPDEHAIVVPAFLSHGYHARTDLPARIAASGHRAVTVTPTLGPGPEITRVVAARLAESGWHSGDAVVLAAAGSSDPAARGELKQTAWMLAGLLGSPVMPAFAATGTPGVGEAVAALRRRRADRVAIGCYLLADGLFHRSLAGAGADSVSEPLGSHPEVARLVAERFRRAGCAAATVSRNSHAGHRRKLCGNETSLA